MQPLRYPDIPDYYQVPSDLEDTFQAAMAARHTAEARLCSFASVADPSAEQVRTQLLAQIALDCAKIASSLAVCLISDWLESEEDTPPFRSWTVRRVSQRRPKRRTPQSGKAEG
jgi:hypothetical protein